MSDSPTRLLVMVINEPDLVDEILAGLLALEVTGATIIDSEGMGRVLSDEIPVFAGLQAAVGAERPKNVTILSVVTADRVDAVMELVESICGDLTAPSTGIVFVLPVERVVGLAPGLPRSQDDGDETGR